MMASIHTENTTFEREFNYTFLHADLLNKNEFLHGYRLEKKAPAFLLNRTHNIFHPRDNKLLCYASPVITDTFLPLLCVLSN